MPGIAGYVIQVRPRDWNNDPSLPEGYSFVDVWCEDYAAFYSQEKHALTQLTRLTRLSDDPDNEYRVIPLYFAEDYSE